ncbi:MAG: hypothetical protein RLZZ46_1275 [Bacteroidota bacterium]|jgi:hypothetical protein
MKAYISVILSFMSILLFSGCKVNYSFTGASISPEVKTISIKNFQNFAPLANARLSQQLTESIKDAFLNQTSLKLVNREGDLQMEGNVVSYQTTPVAIQGAGNNSVNTAASNRLTITISVKFTNIKDEKQNYDTQFSRFADFPSSSSLAAEEDRLIREINTQLVQDIFNKSLTNW